ncbi:hypothetical protein ACA910_014375 [Epithemia clementina (nom. ined.)]
MLHSKFQGGTKFGQSHTGKIGPIELGMGLQYHKAREMAAKVRAPETGPTVAMAVAMAVVTGKHHMALVAGIVGG